MRSGAALAAAIVALVGASWSPDRDRAAELRWSELPPLPANTVDWSDAIPGEPHWRSLGLAGPIAGAHGDHLIAGGGANFPEPAKTANRDTALGKVYWNEVFVLRRERDGRYRWLERSFRLPDSIAYAATMSTDRGVLVIGGEGFRGGPNGTKRVPLEQFADVFYLRGASRAGSPARRRSRRRA